MHNLGIPMSIEGVGVVVAIGVLLGLVVVAPGVEHHIDVVLLVPLEVTFSQGACVALVEAHGAVLPTGIFVHLGHQHTLQLEGRQSFL